MCVCAEFDRTHENQCQCQGPFLSLSLSHLRFISFDIALYSAVLYSAFSYNANMTSIEWVSKWVSE